MLRFATVFAATLTFAAAAHAGVPVYRAVPAAAVSGTKIVSDGLLWRCGADGCVATNATSRASIVCAQTAREVGKLERFSVNAEDFDAEALAKCNAKAKG